MYFECDDDEDEDTHDGMPVMSAWDFFHETPPTITPDTTDEELAEQAAEAQRNAHAEPDPVHLGDVDEYFRHVRAELIAESQ